ncbi:MAG: thioredoxin domain-containing protein [Candidatus Nitrosotenuis sp.]
MASGFASYIVIEVSANYDDFAKCLTDKGVKMYGASWCQHCQQQRESFGTSQKFLNYIECSTQDGKSQTTVCKNNNITSYPTWELADGTRLVGTQSLSKLSEISGCDMNNK